MFLFHIFSEICCGFKYIAKVVRCFFGAGGMNILKTMDNLWLIITIIHEDRTPLGKLHATEFISQSAEIL